ncbi:hypothetical protein [Streptomyces indiaensis]
MNGTNRPAARGPGRLGHICVWNRCRRSALISSALHAPPTAAEPAPSA